MPEFLQVFRAEGAVDDAMVAAHSDAHPLAAHDRVAIIDHRFLHDRADGKNEALRRINDGREIVDAVAAEVRDREGAALEFFGLHSLVPRPMRQIFYSFADLAERLTLGG